jgi:hypothetical protein
MDLSSAEWHKSSSSGSNGCIEVATLGDRGVAVRDSKEPEAHVLQFTRREWAAFLDGVLAGEFDLEP